DLALGHAAKREAELPELPPGGGMEEIGLVARHVARRKEPAAVAVPSRIARRIMPGDERRRRQRLIAAAQIGEFHRAVAGDAWHRRLAPEIAVGEVGDHRIPEAALEIEHIMGNAEAGRRPPCIIDVLTGAAPPTAA